MTKMSNLVLLASTLLLTLSSSGPAEAQQSSMSFFITSVGIGRGGDLGGLDGADRHCQSLA